MGVPHLSINVTDISDYLAMEENHQVESILERAQDVVKEGGKVVLQQEFDNADPIIKQVLSTEKEVLQWKSDLNKTQEKLGKKALK